MEIPQIWFDDVIVYVFTKLVRSLNPSIR